MNDDVSLSNPFFKGMLTTFANCEDAAVVVPRYNGYFNQQARAGVNRRGWYPEEHEQAVPFVDGTCMLLSLQTIQTIGFLDPSFQHPGWGADVDYSYRVTQAGKKLYVSHRAMLWHAHRDGGTSALQIYGGKANWQARGRFQAKSDLEAKYGPSWRTLLPLDQNEYISNEDSTS